MKVCVVSFKDCWQDKQGNWLTYGGFPAQMAAICSLFDEMTLVVVRGQAREGGIPLPTETHVIPLQEPKGLNTRRKLFVMAYLPYYMKIITQHASQADVVHVPVPGDIAFLGMIVALFLRKPLIARYGSSWETTSHITFMNKLTKAIMRRFAGGRNVMFATGVGDSPPAENMNWIFATALSLAELKQVQPLLSRGLSDPPRLVYIGRLSREKGVRYLINAIARLNQPGFKIQSFLTIVGDGPERSYLEALVHELGCRDRIKFVGQLDRRDLSSQLSVVDYCVQPSLTEGYSKAWLDAMAHGLPVLTTDVGAARHVVGENGERGWLVKPGSSEELAVKIDALNSNHLDWIALRQRCRAYVEERTLEAWSNEIGRICAEQWNIRIERGKFRK